MAQKPHRGLAIVIGRGQPRPTMSPEQRRQHAADVEADFTGRPQPHGTYDAEHDGGKVSADTAGYMELEGAAKSGDCGLVQVAGGVSGDQGCCNLFDPQQGAASFCCEECEHFSAQPQAQQAEPQEAA